MEVTFRTLEVLRATKTQPRVTKHSKTKQLRAGVGAGVGAGVCADACAGMGAWDPSAEEADWEKREFKARLDYITRFYPK